MEYLGQLVLDKMQHALFGQVREPRSNLKRDRSRPGTEIPVQHNANWKLFNESIDRAVIPQNVLNGKNPGCIQ